MGRQMSSVSTMSCFEEWMTGFLNEPEFFRSAKQKEDAAKAFLEFSNYENEETQNLDLIKEVCRRIDTYVSNAKPRKAVNPDQTSVMDPFFCKVVEFSISLAVFHPEIHSFLREESGMISNLTSLLKDKYRPVDEVRLLQAIEVFTRGIIVSWSAPFLNSLMKHMFGIILSASAPTERSMYGFRIISNLVFNNQSSLNIVLREPSYKDVLKRTLDLLTDREANPEFKALAQNFCYMVDYTISAKVSTQINNIRNAFEAMTPRNGAEPNVQGMATAIYYLTMCVSTILARSAEGFEMAGVSPENNQAMVNPVKSTVEQILNIVFARFFAQILPVLRTEKGQVIVLALLNLMKALCPNNISVETYDSLWNTYLTSLNELSVIASSNSKVQVTVLETHLHFVEKISKSDKKEAIAANAFTFALSHFQIVASTNAVDLTRNILTIRLLNRLNALAASQSNRKNDANLPGTSVAEQVSKLLSEEALSKILFELLSEKTDEEEPSSALCLKMSTCIVEILNVISKLAKSPTALMESLEKEKTWFHISNCIVNGNEELINQALALLGAVGFSAKCRIGVARTLIEMRASFAIPKDLLKSPERPTFNSVAAQVGMKKLNDHLEMFEENHMQGTDPGIDDVLAWYKLKNDMHEAELASTNEHIFHLNKTINHLKALLEKQAEVVTKRAVTSASMKKDFGDLQRQLEVTKQKKVDLEVKHMKAVECLRKQLNFQEQLYKTKCERVAQLEVETEELKKTNAELRNYRDESLHTVKKLSIEKKQLHEQLADVTEEYNATKKKLATTEATLQRSQDARTAAESLLEAERRKTEIIQQVLGNRSN